MNRAYGMAEVGDASLRATTAVDGPRSGGALREASLPKGASRMRGRTLARLRARRPRIVNIPPHPHVQEYPPSLPHGAGGSQLPVNLAALTCLTTAGLGGE